MAAFFNPKLELYKFSLTPDDNSYGSFKDFR